MVAEAILPGAACDVLVAGIAILGIVYSIWCTMALKKISLTVPDADSPNAPLLTQKERESLATLAEKTEEIQTGAKQFLFQEYQYMAVFILIFSGVILVLLGFTDRWDNAIFSVIAFILGACTSIASGWIGMMIAVYTNGRTALVAKQGSKIDTQKGYEQAFATAFTGGIVMGFALTSLGLLNLFVGINCFYLYFYNTAPVAGLTAAERLFGAISAYGLGGSTIALFGRVGGGIFTKAADVGSDLAGKVGFKFNEDDPRNPGVIADCIGDNVGDIAGMGSDLFGSFGESSCAALVVASTCVDLTSNWSCMMYPLMISATGLLVCFGCSFVATHVSPANKKEDIEPTLRKQLIYSTVAATGALFLTSILCLPGSFSMQFMNGSSHAVKNWYCFLCVACGLWSGLIIGIMTERYTSNAFSDVQELSRACKYGAGPNVIGGLALGYKSAIIPATLLAVTIYISYNLASVYGIALSALGILSTMSIGLTVDAYGPISDNAGGIAELADLGEDIRNITDDLDAAGNTTAAIGKGYAIGSAALVAVALYGAFLSRAFVSANPGAPVLLNIVDPRTYFGLLFGAMLPYWFSAMTMKSVGMAAQQMVQEIQRQIHNIPGLKERAPGVKPDSARCVKIATDASLQEMIPPGLLVILSPIFFGIVLGPEALGGLLPGSVVSGVQMAISMSNTGGAWDNAKKYVEAGEYFTIAEGGGLKNVDGKWVHDDQRDEMDLTWDDIDMSRTQKRDGRDQHFTKNGEPVQFRGKGTATHDAAVIGDTVGDPLKDTSGPALNILVKLMAIISVVFAPVVATNSPLGGVFFNKVLGNWAARDVPVPHGSA